MADVSIFFTFMAHNFLEWLVKPQGTISSWRPSFQVWYFHYMDKTIVRPSYLYNGNPYTVNMAPK